MHGVYNSANPSVIGVGTNQVAYVTGHNIAVYNLDSKQTTYIPGKPQHNSLLAQKRLTLCPHVQVWTEAWE